MGHDWTERNESNRMLTKRSDIVLVKVSISILKKYRRSVKRLLYQIKEFQFKYDKVHPVCLRFGKKFFTAD
jgi:hypothetical protein